MKFKIPMLSVLPLAIIALTSCGKSSTDLSDQLVWGGGNGNDIDLLNVPQGFQNAGTVDPTPIQLTLSGTMLDEPCMDYLGYTTRANTFARIGERTTSHVTFICAYFLSSVV